jgi:hypothetical protein
MKRSPYILVILVITCILLTLPLTACTNSQSTQSSTLPGQQTQPTQGNAGGTIQGQVGTGRIEVYVTDAPSKKKEITSVILTVSSIEIHTTGNQGDKPGSDNTTITNNTTKGKGQDQQQSQPQGGDTWIKINFTGSRTFDLLKIKGFDQLFAAGELQAGKYTQVRLIVDSASVGFSDNTTEVATIPSGEVKFVKSFDVIAGKTTMLIFDFDAEKSVNVTGGDKVMIKPVVKLDVKQK